VNAAKRFTADEPDESLDAECKLANGEGTLRREAAQAQALDGEIERIFCGSWDQDWLDGLPPP
jgi:hypothetical protein